MKMHSYELESIRFEWLEGAYIEVLDKGQAWPFDVINVWDYVNDCPRIEKTREAFIAECDEYAKRIEAY